MYINIVFIGYIAAVFLSLASFCFVLIPAVLRRSSRPTEFPFLCLFTATAFIYSLFYFFLYYQETVFDQLWISALWRVVDYTLSGIHPALWILLLWQLEGRRHPAFPWVPFVSSVVYILSAWIVAAWFMDGYYFIADSAVRLFFLILQTLFTGLTAFLLLRNCAHCKIQQSKICVWAVSISLALLGILQLTGNQKLYAGLSGGSLWKLELVDPTGPLMVVANLAILIFILQTDYSPVYLVESGDQAVPMGPDLSKPSESDSPSLETPLLETAPTEPSFMGQAELLDTAAEIYGLTGREREVMKLVYDGLSNPDIAKDLSITLSTVKGHIHNIFEKMGVSNRIELIHCINAQTAPLKLTQHTKIEKTSRSDG